MEELLKQQYQREERTRLKNKQAERLLIHGLESRKGIRALHEYRLQIVNKEQKELARELERIQADLPVRRRKVSKEPSTIIKESKHPSPQPSRSHITSTLTAINPRHARQSLSQSTTVNSSPTRRSSRNFYEDDFEKDSDENDDDDDDDEDGRDSDGNNNTFEMPDKDVLKAIMRSMISDWERRASHAVELQRRRSMALTKERPETPEFYESSNSSLLLGSREKNYTSQSLSKWKGSRRGCRGHDNNKKLRGGDQPSSDRSRTKAKPRKHTKGENSSSVESRVSRWRSQTAGGVGGGGGGGQGHIVVDKEGAHFYNEEPSTPTVHTIIGPVHGQTNNNSSTSNPNSHVMNNPQTIQGESSSKTNAGINGTFLSKQNFNSRSSIDGQRSGVVISDTTKPMRHGGCPLSSPPRDVVGGPLAKQTHTRPHGKHSRNQSSQIGVFAKSPTRVALDNLYNNNADNNVNAATRIYRSRNNDSNTSLNYSNNVTTFPSGRTTREDNNSYNNSLYSSRLDYHSNNNTMYKDSNGGLNLMDAPITARSTRSLPVIQDKTIVDASPASGWQSLERKQSMASPWSKNTPTMTSPEVASKLLRSHTGSPYYNVFSKNPKIHIYKGKDRTGRGMNDGEGNSGVNNVRNKKLKGRIIMKIKDTRDVFGGKSAPVGGSGGGSGGGGYSESDNQAKGRFSPLNKLTTTTNNNSDSKNNPNNTTRSSTNQGQALSTDKETNKRYTRHSQLDDGISRRN